MEPEVELACVGSVRPKRTNLFGLYEKFARVEPSNPRY